MNLKKSWLIGFLVAAGGVYFWLGDDNPQAPEEVADRPVTEQSGYRSGHPSRPKNTLPGRRAPGWEGRDYRPAPESQYGMPYGTFAPSMGSTSGSLPQEGGYSFRPQEGKAETEPNWQAPSYQTTPPRQDYASPPAIIGRNDLERSYQTQGPAGTGYQFRPQNSVGRPQRWTGNYYQAPGTAPLPPMRPDKSQPPRQYPSPWQQSVPKTGNNSLWADTRVLP